MPVRILTVCSHNRTRSVMMAALLDTMLKSRLAPERVFVESAGFGPEGIAAIDDAVTAMQRRDLDVSDHRSRQVTVELLASADLVLTAERAHVVKIAALSPTAFRIAMTLPEFLARGVAGPIADVDGVASWAGQLTAQRSAGTYLREAVPEIDDPTGAPRRVFESAVVEIEQQCLEAADLIARAATRC